MVSGRRALVEAAANVDRSVRRLRSDMIPDGWPPAAAEVAGIARSGKVRARGGIFDR
jgi:hypothetical protein